MTLEDHIRETRDEVRELRGELEALAKLVREHAGPRGDRLLRPETLAEIFELSPQTLAKWARDGTVKRYGTPRLILISEAELRAHLAGKKKEDGPTDDELDETARRKAMGA